MDYDPDVKALADRFLQDEGVDTNHMYYELKLRRAMERAAPIVEQRRRNQANPNPFLNSQYNVDSFIEKPLNPGKDDRGYPDSDVRLQLRKQLALNTLNVDQIPQDFQDLFDQANQQGGMYYDNQGVQQNKYLAFEFDQGGREGKRTSEDTPIVHSPRHSDNQLFHRTEKAHLFPARSGWGENDAVEVPMVGNQVVDTFHEEMVNKFGGQIAKIVTPDRVNTISRTNDNQVHASSYPRVNRQSTDEN